MELSFTLLTTEKQFLALLLTSDLLSHKNAAAPPHICIVHLQQQKESVREKQLPL